MNKFGGIFKKFRKRLIPNKFRKLWQTSVIRSTQLITQTVKLIIKNTHHLFYNINQLIKQQSKFKPTKVVKVPGL